MSVVRAVDVDPDYRYRPEPEKTVEDVRALKYLRMQGSRPGENDRITGHLDVS